MRRREPSHALRMCRDFTVTAIMALLIPQLPACNDVHSPAPDSPDAPREPTTCPDANGARRAYFGDLHVHTTWSLDAYGFGNTVLDPSDAIAFARGAQIIHPTGAPYAIDRPLDFVALTDHAEFFDLTGACRLDPDNPAWHGRTCRLLRNNPAYALVVLAEAAAGLDDFDVPNTTALSEGRNYVWKRVREIADEGNEPCTFTTFIGYEWTGGTLSGELSGGNLHRNVIFASNRVPAEPFDARRFRNERELWRALEDQCTNETGCDAVTIPHNANQSREGRMWRAENDEAIRLRDRYERLVEIYQHKGNSECSNRNLDPQDPGYDAGCAFESLSLSSPADALRSFNFGGTEPQTDPNMIRSGWQKGLALYEHSATNPFELGVVAGTDTHDSTPGAVSEITFRGHNATFWEADERQRLTLSIENSPGGLTGIWAERNTRASLFAALKRREVFATSGPRITLQVFATHSVDDYCNSPPALAALRTDGAAVPMGGRWQAGSALLVVTATADTVPLDRIELVTVGPASSKVTTITMPRTDAMYLCTTVALPKDSEPTLRYVRAIEQPTPRWTWFACRQRPDLCDAETPLFVEERAWSSPIWFYPVDTERQK